MDSLTPVLSQFGAAIEGVYWTQLGSGGGFSGSTLWRGEDNNTPLYALKAWPESMTEDRLARIHRWMKHIEHLPIVPRVIRAITGASFVINNGRLWDITQWMPGAANFHTSPSSARLQNACAALAEVHRAWRSSARMSPECPALLRRLRVLDEWNSRSAQAARSTGDFLLADRANKSAVRLVAPAQRALRTQLSKPFAVQPCLCDIWHDHVLFTDDRVTGIIDYGAMKEDHIAVDLARMLGDFCGENDAMFETGLDCYRQAGGAIDVSQKFIRLLDRTGVLCGVLVWMMRFSDDSKAFSRSPEAIKRFEMLVARLCSIHDF